MTALEAMKYRCTHCGAQPKAPCTSLQGGERPVHSARWHAAEWAKYNRKEVKASDVSHHATASGATYWLAFGAAGPRP